MKIKIADFKVEIKNKYNLIEKMCSGYFFDFDEPDFFIETTDADIENEKLLPHYQPRFSDAYLETVNVYRKLCFMLPEKGALMLHSAVFTLKEKGIALLANSGTGKTTHMMLYKELFGDEMTIINGDKPIIRFIEGKPYAYGTPWCGKERLSENTKALLTDICFINRSEKNKTFVLDKNEAIGRILRQVYLPRGGLAAANTLDILNSLFAECDVWQIDCTKEPEAAKTSYNAIFKLYGDSI